MAGPRESRSAVASSLDNLRRVRGLGGLDFVVVLMVALNVFVTGMKAATQRRTEREKYVGTACGEKKESVNNFRDSERHWSLCIYEPRKHLELLVLLVEPSPTPRD
jgi:hypothetical protein